MPDQLYARPNRGRLLLTAAESIDRATVTGEWIRGEPVEVRE